MAAVAELKALLGMDASQYKAGMRDATGATNGFQQTLSSVGRAMGAAFSVGAIISAGRQVVKWGADVSEAAVRAGVLTSEMIALNRVGIQGGLDTGDMAKMLIKLQDTLYAAAKGGKEATEKFTNMGLSIEDLIKMDPTSMLISVTKAAEATGMPIETLSELFGEKLGGKAMKALREIAKDGLPTITGQAAEAADACHELTDKWAYFWDMMKEKSAVGALRIGRTLTGAGRFWGSIIASGDQGGAEIDKALAARKGPAAATSEIPKDNAAKQAELKKLKDQADIEAANKMIADADNKSNAEGAKRFDEAMRDLEAQGKKWESFKKSEAGLKSRGSKTRSGMWQDFMQGKEKITGEGMNFDSMAKTGGFVGGSRGGLAVADRALKVQQEMLETEKRIERNGQEQSQAIRELYDAFKGSTVE